MQKFTYYLFAAFVSFIIGIISWLSLSEFSINPSPTEKNVIFSGQSKKEISQNDTDNLSANSQESVPLPCSRLGADPSKPWEHISKVLDSFPPDNPLPKFIGTFQDRNWKYRLDLYRDSKGVFGEISSPVLEADSPTSRLYEVVSDSKNSLQFRASFSDGFIQFSGFLGLTVVKGEFTQNNHRKTVTLKKLKQADESFYTSRSQFDCAMNLFGNY